MPTPRKGYSTSRRELCLNVLGFGAILEAMAAVRSFAAALLSFLASTATAQNIVVTVVDTSGARIPGAQIGIIKLPDAASKAGD